MRHLKSFIGRLGFWNRKGTITSDPRVPDGLRVYAIGDIHGRLDLLDRMHDLIRQDWSGAAAHSAHVVYLGDYVDRGPESAGVLDRLCSAVLPGTRRTFIGGNHEEMLLNYIANPSTGRLWMQFGGLETLRSYGVPMRHLMEIETSADAAEGLAQRIAPDHRKFLSALETSLILGDYFFCHAGVRPSVPLSAQSPQDMRWIRDEFLSSEADFGAVVVHGHSPVAKPDVRKNRINIDTGAYATGVLTCLVLEGTERRWLQAMGQ